MKVNIISILVVVVFTYILTLNVLIASQAAIILILILGLIECFQKFFLKKGKKRLPKKVRIERNINFGLLIVVLLCFGFYYTPFAKYYSEMYKMMSVYKKMSTAPIINAINNIKKKPNNMNYCALLLLPSLKNNSEEAISKYLALYKVGEKYCDQYGPWFQNDCAYLKSMNYSGYPIELNKNIRLCKIANSKEFQERLNKAGYQNGKQ